MEMYQEPPPVENPLEDPDSPMKDMLPLEPEPVTCYEPASGKPCFYFLCFFMLFHAFHKKSRKK